MSGTRILVTGAAGFLGWNFIKLLVDEDRCYRFRKDVVFIRCLDMQEPPFKQLKNENRIQLEFVKADITDPIAVKEATKGINSIFHFAAVISFNYFDSEERVQKINFGGTKNVIDAGIENGVDRFLYASTIEVINDDNDHFQADETWPYIGKTAYSRSKIRSEKYLKEKQGTETTNGKKFKYVVLRPLGMYGEGDPYHIKNILSEAHSGRLICRLGDGSSLYHYIYVGNMAYGFMLAHERMAEDPEKVSGQVFFLTDDTKPCNLFEFGKPFLELKGYKYPKMYIPYTIALVIAFIMQLFSLILSPITKIESAVTVTSVKHVCSTLIVTDKKARHLLDYKPIFGFDECMQRSMDFWKADKRFNKPSQ